jgi:serine/threonine protein kinase
VRKLGYYTLTHRLGVGGMGEVWKGRREALGGAARDVAIKLLSRERASNAQAHKMFLDEARLSMLLCNSNIVQVHDVAETDDKTCYMVMEFVEGLDLAELSERMRKAGEAMPDSIAAFIIGEVLKGLAHAHELRHEGQLKSVVHRDVSPHNVMISVFGEVKIMDFGIARVASEDTSGVHVKGKLRYMPPEQLRGETREPTVDLFAVGAMLHELLDGTKFRGDVVDEARLFGMILDGEVPQLQRAPETVPRQLEELRQLLLAPAPNDRIQSARLAFRQLTAWSGYRDTRFELDELVRRHVGQPEPQAVGELRASADADATSLLSTDGSETEIGVVSTAGSSNAVVSRTSPGLSTSAKLVSAVVGVSGLVAVLFGASVMFGESGEDEAARGEDEDVRDVEPEVEPPADPPAVPDETAPIVEEPIVEERIVEEPIVEEPIERPADQVEEAAEAPASPEPAPEQPAAKTKVSLSLGAGVGWAEVKIGTRTFELDAFSGKGASTRLAPGSHAMSCRMQVKGTWQNVGPVKIRAGKATIRLDKNCKATVEQ